MVSTAPDERKKVKPKSERVQVILPSRLAARVRSTVPIRQRSAFIADAVETAISREEQMRRQQRELEAAIWSDDDYPYLNTREDISEWRDAIWSGEDPHAVLRAKYAKQGVVTKRDYTLWLETWRATDDPAAAFRAVKRSKPAIKLEGVKRRRSA